MLYLLLAIVFGSLFSVVFKLCQQRGIDTEQVILFNYVTALIVTAVPVVCGLFSASGEYLLPLSSILLTVFQGAMFLLGFVVMNRCTWRSGVALTTVMARASLVLPVLLSFLLLEQPSPSWLAVALVIAAMFLLVLPAENEKHDPALLTNKTDAQRNRLAALMLVAVFFVYGTSDFTLKVVQSKASGEGQLSSMMTCIFLFASVFALCMCFVKGSFKKHPVGWKSLAAGVLLGLINTGCTSCILRALGAMSTGLFYPLYNVGIVLVATLVGVLFFKEKLKWLQVLGLAVAVAAIALIC